MSKKFWLRSCAVILCAVMVFTSAMFVIGRTSAGKTVSVEPAAASASDAAQTQTQTQTRTAAAAPSAATGSAAVVASPAGQPAETIDKTPTIIVPGIGQSATYEYDANGNIALDEDGKQITGWPFHIVAKDIIINVIGPLIYSLITQQDKGLSKALDESLRSAFSVNAKDANGYGINDVRTVKFEKSVADCTAEEKAFIYGKIPLQSYSAIVGEENLYFFAYDSFARTMDLGEELYQYIQMVKQQRGSDKVNVVAISMGGTIANALLEEHKSDLTDTLNKMIYIVPALNGSKIVSDIYAGNIDLSDESLYDTLFPSLMDDYTGYLANLAVRLLPKEVVKSVVNSAVNAFVDELFKNCPSLWALVPAEDYEALADKWLSGSDNASMRSITEQYHQAQLNSTANIQYMIDAGTQVYDCVDYNYPLYSIVNSSKLYNADGIIHIGSTGMGVYSVPKGQTFPDGYTQQNTYCTDSSHNHISPEDNVDASTGYLPETTWYFSGQDHESTGHNTDIMNLAVKLLTTTTPVTVWTWAEYPQFIMARQTGDAADDVQKAQSYDTTAMSESDKAEFDSAVTTMQALISKTLLTADDAKAYADAQSKLESLLVKYGLMSAATDNTADWKYKLFKSISDLLWKNIGGKGYSEIRVSDYIPK